MMYPFQSMLCDAVVQVGLEILKTLTGLTRRVTTTN
jgi:hypothetical protein